VIVRFFWGGDALRAGSPLKLRAFTNIVLSLFTFIFNLGVFKYSVIFECG